MHEIIQYGIATNSNYEKMAEHVNEQITYGYQPYGPPFTTTYDNRLFFHQAMVLYDLKKKTNLK